MSNSECIFCLEDLKDEDVFLRLPNRMNDKCKCRFEIHLKCLEDCNYKCPICKNDIEYLTSKDFPNKEAFDVFCYHVKINHLSDELMKIYLISDNVLNMSFVRNKPLIKKKFSDLVVVTTQEHPQVPQAPQAPQVPQAQHTQQHRCKKTEIIGVVICSSIAFLVIFFIFYFMYQ